MVLATTPRTTWSLRCALPTRTWSPPPSARFPSTSALRTLSGFPWLAARVRDFLFKSVSTSQNSSLVPLVKVRTALPRLVRLFFFFSLFSPLPYLILMTNPQTAHHNVVGAFSLETCLRFPSLLPKPACQGQLFLLVVVRRVSDVPSPPLHLFFNFKVTMDWDPPPPPPPKILNDKVFRPSHFFFAWAGVRLDEKS